MNVIIICDYAVPSGGSQTVAIESARALADIGVSVDFLHAIPGSDPRLDHPLITRTCAGLQDVWDRPLAGAAVAGIWNGASKRQLASVLSAPRASGSTLIHIHQWTRAFSPSIFKFALASDLPVVVTAHDYFLTCPNGVYFRFERQQPCHVKPLSLACLAAGCDPKSPAHKAIRVMRTIATSAAISGKSLDIVHVSDRGRDTLVPLLPARLRHHRIDNPVALSKTAPADIEHDAAFAFIGRLTREKGAVVAAEAARVAGVPILFIGDGPAEAEIRASNPDAKLLGWCGREDIAALLAGKIKAVVTPSLWLETGPLTVYEASAAGVAAIASNRCGAAEHVDHGTSGLVVDPTAEAIAAAMRQLDDLATAQGFGRAAYRKYWADPPTSEAHALHLKTLYRDILARAP